MRGDYRAASKRLILEAESTVGLVIPASQLVQSDLVALRRILKNVRVLFLAGFMIFMYGFETFLDIRQHKALKLPTLPGPLKGVVSQEKFEKARAYSLDKR